MISDPMVSGEINYVLVREQLTKEQIIDLAFKVQQSERFQFGEQGHVVLRQNPDIAIGYVGINSARLCLHRRENYEGQQSLLREIFHSV
jgi:hypothetical protein